MKLNTKKLFQLKKPKSKIIITLDKIRVNNLFKRVFDLKHNIAIKKYNEKIEKEEKEEKEVKEEKEENKNDKIKYRYNSDNSDININKKENSEKDNNKNEKIEENKNILINNRVNK